MESIFTKDSINYLCSSLYRLTNNHRKSKRCSSLTHDSKLTSECIDIMMNRNKVQRNGCNEISFLFSLNGKIESFYSIPSFIMRTWLSHDINKYNIERISNTRMGIGILMKKEQDDVMMIHVIQILE